MGFRDSMEMTGDFIFHLLERALIDDLFEGWGIFGGGVCQNKESLELGIPMNGMTEGGL